jgi:hypothetical protein
MMRHLGLAAMFLFLVGCGPQPGGGWVMILDPDGEPVPFDWLYPETSPLLVARNAESGEVLAEFDLETDTEGRLAIPALPDGEEAVLMSAGYRDLVFPVPLPKEPMRLLRGYPVRLKLETEGDLPPAPLSVACTLTWRGPGDASDAIVRHGLVTNLVFRPSESEAVFHLSVPARYRIIWGLQRTSGSVGHSSTRSVGAEGVGTSILVADRPREQEFTLFLDPAVLAEGVQSLTR